MLGMYPPLSYPRKLLVRFSRECRLVYRTRPIALHFSVYLRTAFEPPCIPPVLLSPLVYVFSLGRLTLTRT